MESEIITEKKGEIKDDFIKNLMSVNDRHMFKINGTQVKVVFSTKKNATDIESALVKIACNMVK